MGKIKEPFFIDAQGRLRTEDREWLVMEKVQKYISEAAEAIRCNSNRNYADYSDTGSMSFLSRKD